LPSPLGRLADRVPLDVASIDRIGGDWRVLARISRGPSPRSRGEG